MKELVEFIAKSLVDKPECVSTEMKNEDGVNRIILYVSQQDVGRIIGKHGKIINSIRTLINTNPNVENYKLAVEEKTE